MKTHFELSKDEIASAVMEFVRKTGKDLSAEAKVKFNCRFVDDKITSLTADVTDGPDVVVPAANPGGVKTNETTVTSA